MKILIVNTFYYPNMQGGAEQSVKLLAEGLMHRGHEVAVFCIDSQSGHEELTEHNGVKIYRYTAHSFNLYKYSYDKKNVGKMEKVLQKLICYRNDACIRDFAYVCRQFCPDVVHTNTTYGMSSYIWKKAYDLRIPVVHTIRDIDIVSPVRYGHRINKFVVRLHHIYMRKLSQYVSAVTAPSEYTLNSSLDIGSFINAKIKRCICNSIDFDKDALEKIIHEKKTRSSERIKFMYAGRLYYFKGIEHLIDAFENMKYKSCELHICGGGDLAEYVEEWAVKDPRIIYHGKLDSQQLSDIYNTCDVLVVPSYWPEPFGRVLIEGNMHGLPVIAGNCGGMPEIINTVQGGMLYEPQNMEELSKAMDKLTDRRRYVDFFNGIITNLGEYDISKQIDAFEAVYCQMRKQ